MQKSEKDTQPTAQEKLSYSLSEVAKLTGLGRTKIYQELNSGRLSGVKLGRRTLVTRESLESWLAALDSYNSKEGRT